MRESQIADNPLGEAGSTSRSGRESRASFFTAMLDDAVVLLSESFSAEEF